MTKGPKPTTAEWRAANKESSKALRDAKKIWASKGPNSPEGIAADEALKDATRKIFELFERDA